ncbi:MAG: O-antigen ligase family protein [Pseudomonadota bacterium]|nr:O-antigen ligase family protein [Pseudomonadota bacterium]MDP1905118.1 O-antigen ligase family protein [Pseudomonadota bacterium]MDP2351974.1 O-antigen ligase family protein [Pseudomonadota bacterium]
MRGHPRAHDGARKAHTASSIPWLYLAPLICVLLPLIPASPLAQPATVESLGDYARTLPQNLYLLIKATLPWIPLGMLAHIGLSGRTRAWLAPAATLLLLVSLPWLQAATSADLLHALYAMPGVALGIWLGGRTLELPGEGSAPRAAMIEDREAPPLAASMDVEEAPSETTEARETVRHPHHHGKRRRRAKPASSPRHALPMMLIGISGLAIALIGGLLFPFMPLVLASGLLLYGILLWFFPLAWLVAVPAALPLLDLAPWSGRFFFDAFDLLFITTAGVLFLKRPAPRQGKLSPAVPALFLALFLAALIGSLPSLLPLLPLDANAFSSYWSPYNSVRVAKGLLWGGLFLVLIRRGHGSLSRVGTLLAFGMGLGLLGVGMVGLWERWLYVGLSDSTQTYRIFATFSSMHTGGGHIEAYLVASLPFLWLGMARFRTLLLAIPLMALTVYVTIYTVSRGGVLALGVVLLVLAVASLRQAWRSGRLIQATLPVGVFVALAAVLAMGIGGGYFQQRFAQTSQDFQTRVEHWKQARAMMDGTPFAQLLGMGLGSFPRIYLERGPSDKQATPYGFLVEKDNTYLRLGTGDTLYYAQRVTASAGHSYQLSADIRSHQQTRLDIPLCEKQMLNSRACVWSEFVVPGDGQWHRYSQKLTNVQVGLGGPLAHPPVELFLYHAGKDTTLDVDNLRLIDENGQDLLCNGSFSKGGDCWFFKTHSHLPWHIKNVWVHVLFEQGWLGVTLFGVLTVLTLARLARAAWAGTPLAWVLLAALAGMLTVGMFDSLLDAPRLATLLWAFILIGGGLPWSAMSRAEERPSGNSSQPLS